MSLIFADRVLETTTTTGTGSLALGGAVTGWRAFSSAMAVNDTACISIWEVDASGNPSGAWETSLATYSAANQLTRTTVIASSNSNAAVSFATGTKRVALTPIAGRPPFSWVSSSGDAVFPFTSAPLAPAADNIGLVPQRISASGYRVLPRFVCEDGIYQTMQAHLGRNSVYWVQGNGGATTFSTQGGPALTTSGTLTARTPTTTNRATRARRTGAVSTATAGNFSGWYPGGGGTQQWTVGTGVALGGGGFLAVFRWVPSDAATVSSAHEFVGLHSGTTPVATTSPAALTNVVGCAQVAGSANLKIVYGGSVAQTAIDLGANFPAGTLSADEYELILYAPPGQNNVITYRVERINTGDKSDGVLTGTAGSALPASTTFLGPKMYRSNNSTALAVGMDLVDIYLESDI